MSVHSGVQLLPPTSGAEAVSGSLLGAGPKLEQVGAAAGNQYTFSMAMGACNFSLCDHWRDEVPKLEAGLASLERQRASIGVGAPTSAKPVAITRPSPDHSPPPVQHERIRAAQACQPLTVTATVTDPSEVRSVRLRFSPVTQFEEYQTLEMMPTAKPNTYAATIPGTAISPTWEFMYFVETIDNVGNGAMWPDFLKEPPNVIVKVRR